MKQTYYQILTMTMAIAIATIMPSSLAIAQVPPTDEPQVIIDRPTAAQLAAEDPYFTRFERV
jgi:hypothetical protein